MRINHNIAAMNTYRQLTNNTTASSKSLEKLSSGLRINRAGDDAAGLAISEKMRGQIRGLNQASRNSQDGISMIQTGEGALATVSNILVRVKELAVQAANGTYDAANDLKRITEEITELGAQVTDIKDNTKFNGISLLNGNSGNNIVLQVGQETAQKLTILTATTDLTAVAKAVTDYAGAWTASSAASTSINDVETQINKVSAMRSYYGANQNRLEYNINNLDTYSENLSASESRIRDVDMANEMMEFTKQNILSQAAQSMLAQANQQPQGVLQLLR
ncbi:flagellin [Ruminiclostridium cellulolyticum]|uniref:Flagellin n=1 Tax=Ruminiclostridium cellulolyticum (strain ATCC 35319 / DSM 5812 / JCM 6584 / H10) TaxID=394503 RepID=B8I4D6_RUMCH|nr:flagellin [Ruminiclostridium cellulolyticum]ACL74490.1 flagellin domain protein [Ruminiclostridium cellulolyticum H10]